MCEGQNGTRKPTQDRAGPTGREPQGDLWRSRGAPWGDQLNPAGAVGCGLEQTATVPAGPARIRGGPSR